MASEPVKPEFEIQPAPTGRKPGNSSQGARRLEAGSGPLKDTSPGLPPPTLLGFGGGRLLVALPAVGENGAVRLLPIELTLNGEPVQVIDGWPPTQIERVGYDLLDAEGFRDGRLPWVLAGSAEGCALGLDFNEQWTLAGGHTGYIGQRPIDENRRFEAVYRDPTFGHELPVDIHGTYILTGYFGLHRCTGRAEVELLDAQREVVRVETASIPQGKFGGRSIEDYIRIERSISPEPGVAYLRLKIVKDAAPSGLDSSMLLFTKVALRYAPPGSILLDLSRIEEETRQRLIEACTQEMFVVAVALPADRRLLARDEVELFYGSERRPALGSPLQMRSVQDVSGRITGMQGCSLEGEVDDSIQRNPDPRIWIYLDDVLIGHVASYEALTERRCRWRFAVGASHYDGRAHVFQALTSEGRLIGEYPVVMPFHLVPWMAIDRYASRPLPAPLAPAAAYRYRALQKHLELFADRIQAAHGDTAGGDIVALQQLAEQHARLGELHRLLVDGDVRPRSGVPLCFPAHENPEVSIVIPIHNKWTITRHCLIALLVAANKASFEVIIVDDGSTDESAEIPSMVSNVTYLRNDTPLGFVLACNRGAALARGEYIVFLNNDTEPTPEWLDELLYVFRAYADVGLAGSRLLYPDGRLQEAGGIVWGNGDPWNYGRNGNPHDPRYCYTRQVDYLSGASIMLPRQIWNDIGGFSEEFVPAYFEDTDLAFKVRAAGKRVVYAPQSTVYHFEGASSGTSTASGMKRFQEVNRPKFKRKWASAYAGNGLVGKDPDIAKDRGVIRRALVIDVGVPRPNNDAGSYAAIQEIRLLQSLGFKTTFVSENLAYLGRDTERLTRMGVETLYAPFVLSVNEVLQTRGAEFDVVYITRYYTALNHIDNVRRLAPNAKILFCNADLHFLRQMREAALSADLTSLNVAEETRTKELDVCRRVDVILSYSDAEHAVLEAHGIPKSKIAMCPWVVEAATEVLDFGSRAGVGYLGGFEHGPNRLAVLFFVEEVLPRLRLLLAEVELRIFGSGSSQALTDLKREGLIVEGFVENVSDAYNACRVFVAPLLTGAGIKGKVIGALAHGLPSVISPIAAEGTGIRDGVEAFVVSDTKEWVDRVALLYTDQDVWASMSRAALDLARSRFGFERGRSQMRQALEAAGIYSDVDSPPGMFVQRAYPV